MILGGKVGEAVPCENPIRLGPVLLKASRARRAYVEEVQERVDVVVCCVAEALAYSASDDPGHHGWGRGEPFYGIRVAEYESEAVVVRFFIIACMDPLGGKLMGPCC